MLDVKGQQLAGVNDRKGVNDVTLDIARETAERLAQEQCKSLSVWRMPLWRAEVYGIIESDRVPPGAIVAAVFESKLQGSLF